MNGKKEILNTLLNTGEKMLLCGAEITRCEDTLSRLAKAYGAVKTDVFVITSSIVLTVTFPENEIYTMSRRIGHDGGTNFIQFEKINALSREVCQKPGTVSIDEFADRLKEIGKNDVSRLKAAVGNFLAAGSLAYFFGGELIDGILAGLMGLLVWFLTSYVAKHMPNKLTFNLICSIFVAVIICLCQIGTGWFMVDKVMIGVIMLLIPGIATTNAVRDMLVGNTISGALRFIKSVILAFMIAAGFMIAIKITGVDATHLVIPDGVRQLIPALISSFGFALLFNLNIKYLPHIAVGGLLAWGVYILAENRFGLNAFWCALIAGFFADFASQILARTMKTPATLFLVPIFIPLIPGSALYYASYFLVTKNIPEFKHYALVTALVVLGMAMGIGFSASIFETISKKKKKPASWDFFHRKSNKR